MNLSGTDNPYLKDDSKALKLLINLQSISKDKELQENKLQLLKRLIKKNYKKIVGGSIFPEQKNTYNQMLNLESEIELAIRFPVLADKKVVAVGGKFSVGKSEFINSILDIKVLPTNISSNTAIPTYICSGEQTEIFAYNIFAKQVKLDKHAFEAITRDFYNQYSLSFTRIIRNIFLKSSGINYKKLVFLDSPGYSKAQIYDVADNTNRDLAYKHLKGAHYLLWIVDISDEETLEKDIKFLKQLDFGGDIFIVLNKADKKSTAEVKAILAAAKNKLLNSEVETVGITAYSAIEDKEYFSDKLSVFLSQVDSAIKNMNLVSELNDIFESSLSYYQQQIELEKDRLKRLKEISLSKYENKSAELISELISEREVKISGGNKTVEKLGRIFKQIIQLVKEISDKTEVNFFDRLKLGSELLAAIKAGDIELARNLISSGAELNLRDEQGRLPLMIAARKEQTEIVRMLVKAGVELLDKGQEIIEDPMIGSGTAEDPFIISLLSGLEKIGAKGYPLDAHYRLGRDIDASSTKRKNYNEGKGWQAIGTQQENKYIAFSGVFDGGGYKISNLYLNRANELKLGLFKTITKGAIIKNITLNNLEVNGKKEVGGLVGKAELATIKNSYVMGRVSGEEFVGGLLGKNRGGEIINCSSEGEVKAKLDVGGLIGNNNYYGRVEESYAASSVSGLEKVGGLIGNNEDGGEIVGSYSAGNIDAKLIVGGLVGYNSGTVKDSYAVGNVFGREAVGGLAGKNELLIGFGRGGIISSYYAGSVKGIKQVAGLVGENRGEIKNTYVIGKIKGEELVGGLVASNYEAIKNSYVSVAISDAKQAGGLIAENNNSSSVINSYWDYDKARCSSSAGGEAKKNSQLKKKSIYKDWDFSESWRIEDSYPYLSWEKNKGYNKR